MLIIELKYEVSTFINGISEYKYFTLYNQAKEYYDSKIKDSSLGILKEIVIINDLESYTTRLEEFERG